MPSEAERRKQALKEAQATAPSEEQLREMATRVAPLNRDEDHSFVDVDETDRETDEELVQPNLTGDVSLADLEADYQAEQRPKPLKITREDRAKSTYEQTTFTENDIERLSDEQIEEAGLLKNPQNLVHPARLSPSSERPRTPGQRAPAAGPGSWPVPEDQLPAVMPSDPPLEHHEDRHLSDNTFTGVTGFTRAKSGDLTLKRAKAGTTLKIGKKEVRAAAGLYLRLRQQFPHFTQEQLTDEFAVQWESAAGHPQSHRVADELSQHGLTAVADDRVTFVDLGKQRASSDAAFEADPTPSPSSGTGAPTPAAGLPSENEPSSTAPDMAKDPSGETAAADEEAVKAAAKFDHDGDGRPGGSPPGGLKRKK